METSDIFTTITRYNKPENRFTASLVYLLRHLWTKSKGNEARRSIYCGFLNDLCGGEEIAWGEQIDFEPQKYERGDEDGGKRIPDFEIVSPNNVLVWVEVKDTAKITQDFKKDKSKLRRQARKSGCAYNRLVLLRHYYISKEESRGVDHDARWSELYRWLRDMADEGTFDDVAYYLLKQFLKHLEGKGEAMVGTITMSNIETGLADFISLMTVVKKEAEGLFDKEGLNFKVETDFGRYHDEENNGDEDYIEFRFLSGRQKQQAYSIGLWANYPKTIFMSLNRDYLESMGKRIIMSRVQQDKDFELDARLIWYERSLETVFQKNSPQEQQDEIGRLLSEMYKRFKQVTGNMIKPRRRT